MTRKRDRELPEALIVAKICRAIGLAVVEERRAGKEKTEPRLAAKKDQKPKEIRLFGSILGAETSGLTT
jgi:hypothetical protein